MVHPEPSGPYLAVLGRAFEFARQTGSGCRPVHVLVGVADGDGAGPGAEREWPALLEPVGARADPLRVRLAGRAVGAQARSCPRARARPG